MIETGLKGKVALVTGANNPRGIGAATARALAAQGAHIFITSYRRLLDAAAPELEDARASGIEGRRFYEAMLWKSPEIVVGEIESQKGRAAWREADLSDPENIPRLFDACEEKLGPVDILVNNHAHWQPDTFDPGLMTGEGFGIRPTNRSIIDAHYEVNARACALLMAEYVKRYLARGATRGWIINVSTDAAHAHYAAVSYAASKHAIESYSRSAAYELGKYGITVNIVAPGPVQTGWLSPEEEADIGLKTPLGRIGRPEDIADVIVFLASEQARWLTGQLIYVGGGWRMHQ